MRADERPEIEDQAETDRKQFPVADVLRFLDAVESAFQQPMEGELNWNNDLGDKVAFAKAIKKDLGVSDRNTMCVSWRESICKYIALLGCEGWSVEESLGMRRRFATLDGIIKILEKIEFKEQMDTPPELATNARLRPGLGKRLNDAIWELRNRLSVAAAGKPEGRSVSDKEQCRAKDLLKATDSQASKFMHMKEWATAKFALKRFGITNPQPTKAATRENGLYEIQIQRRKNIDRVYVYHVGDLMRLNDAIRAEK